MRNLWLMLVLLSVVCTTEAAIYHWNDKQGTVHFSDVPHPGAKQLNMPKAQGFSSPSPMVSTPQPTSSDLANSRIHTYSKVLITKPENETTIRNNHGTFSVSVQIAPDLYPGDQVQLLFDEHLFGKPQTIGHFQLSGIDRGAHRIAAQVIDSEGEVLNTSDTIQVFVFRPRVGMVPPK